MYSNAWIIFVTLAEIQLLKVHETLNYFKEFLVLNFAKVWLYSSCLLSPHSALQMGYISNTSVGVSFWKSVRAWVSLWHSEYDGDWRVVYLHQTLQTCKPWWEVELYWFWRSKIKVIGKLFQETKKSSLLQMIKYSEFGFEQLNQLIKYMKFVSTMV